MPTGVSIIEITQKGNDFITGGVFGPEGGLISFLAMCIGAVCIYFWVKRQYGDVKLRILDNLMQGKKAELFTPGVEELTTN
jgi:uncharacterized membrane protein YdjX (TVP38/TMEM64 family)